jgi:ABC-2 type transport system ATP-binding protein
MTDSPTAAVLTARNVGMTFKRETGETVKALDGVSLDAWAGSLTTLVGPDGSGKTTLLRLAAGLLKAGAGDLTVLGIEAAKDPQAIQDRISYMPQRFGLYEDLSVEENVDLYADLHGVTHAERAERYPQLMAMTALGPFRKRLAGKLSGGMKQKLGLACTLVRLPQLLLLDEPTVGVDPLSRRELWSIVDGLVRKDRLAVIVSTSYLDEAERSDHVVVMHEGRILTQGAPGQIRDVAAGRTFLATPARGQAPRNIQARVLDLPGVVDAVPQGGKVRLVVGPERLSGASLDPATMALLGGATVEASPAGLEDGFMILLRAASASRPAGATHAAAERPTHRAASGEVVIEVKDLVRKFGDFIAVNRTSFEVRRGEIFGLLGPNGAGKTTTFRMLCGLLPATSGTLHVAGADLRTARADARQHVGYVSQKFALYGKLSVRENLEFFGGSYGLRNAHLDKRIAWAMEQFDLASMSTLPSEQLPGGFKQRLAMAAALLHEPQILFLDEPTSGADPLARREFWKRITFLAEQGTTVVVTTHFMEEAEYCDRLIIQDAGVVLAGGTPEEVRSTAGGNKESTPTMEDAFIAVVARARQEKAS